MFLKEPLIEYTSGVRYQEKKKTFISEETAAKRLDFVKINWDTDFDSWIFYDECAIRFDNSLSRGYCWMEKEDIYKERFYQNKSQNEGGLIMIWGCVVSFGIRPLIFFNGFMDILLYLELLKNSQTFYSRAESRWIAEDCFHGR